MGTASGPVNFASAGSAKPYKIVGGSAQTFFSGDAVRLVVSGDTDYSATAKGAYIIPWANGDGAGSPTKILVGIFTGCEYYSTSQKKTVYNNYFPGADSASDAVAYVVDDPLSQWMVQCGSTHASASASTSVWRLTCGEGSWHHRWQHDYDRPVGYVPPSNTLRHHRTRCRSEDREPSNLALPPEVVRTDQTTAHNNVIVAFNNQQYKALLGV